MSRQHGHDLVTYPPILVELSIAEITSLFSDLMFEKRLSQISEGNCPYCAIPFAERVLCLGTIYSRCECCGGNYRTHFFPKYGPCWFSTYSHDCAHTSAWYPDEDAQRARVEFRTERRLKRAGRFVRYPR